MLKVGLCSEHSLVLRLPGLALHLHRLESLRGRRHQVLGRVERAHGGYVSHQMVHTVLRAKGRVGHEGRRGHKVARCRKLLWLPRLRLDLGNEGSTAAVFQLVANLLGHGWQVDALR